MDKTPAACHPLTFVALKNEEAQVTREICDLKKVNSDLEKQIERLKQQEKDMRTGAHQNVTYLQSEIVKYEKINEAEDTVLNEEIMEKKIVISEQQQYLQHRQEINQAIKSVDEPKKIPDVDYDSKTEVEGAFRTRSVVMMPIITISSGQTLLEPEDKEYGEGLL